MNRFATLLLVLLGFRAHAFQLRSFHFEATEDLTNSRSKSAVGLLVYQQTKTQWVIQSGFFYGPDKFITAFNPEQEKLPDLKAMRVYTGIDDISALEIRARETHELKSVVLQNAHYGFIVLRTKTKNSSHIPLPTEDENKGWTSAAKIYLTGYTRRGEFLVSHDCRPKIGACMICDQQKKAKLVSAAWGQADCLYKKGMMGGPIFYISEGKWLPIGFMGSYTGSAGKFSTGEIGEQVSLVRLLALQKEFGKDIDASFEEDEEKKKE